MALMTCCVTHNCINHTVNGWLVHVQMGKVMGSDELQLSWPTSKSQHI